jgi:hypothetical protein
MTSKTSSQKPSSKLRLLNQNTINHHPRSKRDLNSKLERNLVSYATVAGAAGVTLLALAQPAAARIVYTATNQRIAGHTFLDLNNDGINDFEFTKHVSTSVTVPRHETFTENSLGVLQVYGVNATNQVWGQGAYASRLSAGVSVGSNGQFPGGKLMGGFSGTDGSPHFYSGPWLGGGGPHQGYLGLKFIINGETHFGWARVKEEITINPLKFKVVLTGYAYETVPNQPIVTGKTSGTDTPSAPGSLGHLAIGAKGKSN